MDAESYGAPYTIDCRPNVVFIFCVLFAWGLMTAYAVDMAGPWLGIMVVILSRRDLYSHLTSYLIDDEGVRITLLRQSFFVAWSDVTRIKDPAGYVTLYIRSRAVPLFLRLLLFGESVFLPIKLPFQLWLGGHSNYRSARRFLTLKQLEFDDTRKP